MLQPFPSASKCQNTKTIPCPTPDIHLTFRALVKFTISGDQYYDNGLESWKDAPPVTIEASMTEADFSGKHLGTSGAIMLAAFLPKCR